MIAYTSWVNSLAIWANLAGAVAAVAMMWRAARETNPHMRPVYAGGCALAAVYVVAYMWLIFHPHHVAAWSETMRPVAAVVWWFVWIEPARHSLRVWRSRGQ